MNKKLITFFWAVTLLLNSCRVGPKYHKPSPLAPEEWKTTHIEANNETPFVEYWWEVFNDSLLNSLEQRAIANSPTLYQALQKVFEARALALAEGSNLYPHITLDPHYTNIGMLFQAFLPSFLKDVPGFPKGAIPPFRIHQMQYLLPINVNYEVDLWGKLRDQYDSAVYNAEAVAESYCSALLTLTSDVASTYFQIRILDAEKLLLIKTIESRNVNYKLTQSRYDKGIVNFLDVTQAKANLATAQAALDDTERLRLLAVNQLAKLTGSLATDFDIPLSPLDSPPPQIPPGLPSTMLSKRPDISQAERQMASEHALIGATYASFLPSFSLTGALGYSTPDLKQFLKWISRYWSIGGGVSQMIFDGGKDYGDLHAAIARFNQAAAGYQQQVIIAFQEVEDALSNIEQYKKQALHLFEAFEAANKAAVLSKNRYVTGVSIYLEVVENERLALEAEINWLRVLSMHYTATIQLIKAIGGSFEALNLSETECMVENEQ